ncbi:hypothetical protein Slin15195_G001670 [Septoria linicola]|uniref:Uncharacterized protein n=1 Tax=Septoria linicola TaxID=215465 RepID=A0A9Q9EF57_9PEZI|nr:hypothetical protein Slin14017_G001700 [Septoria linicola]USW46848.1 hypothetical protein Slin15195_G001670 [Septoria linicola]
MPHDREGLFNAARQPKRSSSTDSRASSTTIDDNGCIITRGFVVPSRSSSQSSLARSTTSSLDTSSTPLSPTETPSPGYCRPSAFSHAHDSGLRPNSSLTSLLRATGIPTTSNRPGLTHRETWQSNSPLSYCSSRWDDDDLETTTCRAADVFPVPPAAASRYTQARRTRRSQTTKSMGHIKRSRSEQTNLHRMAIIDNKAPSAPAQGATEIYRAAGQQTSGVTISSEHADNAIESDSDEDDFLSSSAQSRCIAAKYNRLDYATRRAATDERNAALMQLAQHISTPDELYSVLPTPIPDASTAEINLFKVSQKLELMSASLADNAIASDSEDDDYTCKGYPETTAALRQAAIHRAHNVAIANVDDDDALRRPELQKRAMSAAALTVRVTEPNLSSEKTSPHKRNSSAGTLTVRLVPPKPTHLFADNVDGVETSFEAKTYEKGSILAIRSLRPSKTRPKPVRGVLKKSGSPPSTAVSTADCSPMKQYHSTSGNAVDRSY